MGASARISGARADGDMAGTLRLHAQRDGLIQALQRLVQTVRVPQGDTEVVQRARCAPRQLRLLQRQRQRARARTEVEGHLGLRCGRSKEGSCQLHLAAHR
jgi:hypothetical protein